MQQYRVFKGTPSQYTVLHAWVRKNKAKPNSCSNCKEERKIQWANISGEYKRELNDWMALCAQCHKRYDNSGNFDTCKYGHLMTEENSYNYPGGGKTACRTCRRREHLRSNPATHKRELKRLKINRLKEKVWVR